MSTPDFQLFTSLRYDLLLFNIPANTANWPSSPIPEGCPLYMLPLHRDRLLQAAEHFNWTQAASRISGPNGLAHLQISIVNSIDITIADPLRVKFILSHDGSVTVETNPVPAVSESTLFPQRLPPPQGEVEKNMNVSPLTGGALTTVPTDKIHGDAPTQDHFAIVPDTAPTPPTAFTSYKTTSRKMYDDARSRVGIQSMTDKKEVLLWSEDGSIMEGSLTSPYFWREGKWVTPSMGSGGQIGTSRRWALEKGLCVEGVVNRESLVEGEECWVSNGVRGFQWGKVVLG